MQLFYPFVSYFVVLLFYSHSTVIHRPSLLKTYRTCAPHKAHNAKVKNYECGIGKWKANPQDMVQSRGMCKVALDKSQEQLQTHVHSTKLFFARQSGFRSVRTNPYLIICLNPSHSHMQTNAARQHKRVYFKCSAGLLLLYVLYNCAYKFKRNNQYLSAHDFFANLFMFASLWLWHYELQTLTLTYLPYKSFMDTKSSQKASTIFYLAWIKLRILQRKINWKVGLQIIPSTKDVHTILSLILICFCYTT